jgi:hypothetical protein
MAPLRGRLAPLPASDHRLPKTTTVTPFQNSNPLINALAPRKAYKNFEHKEKPKPTGNDDDDLCAALKHAEEVLKKRKDFGEKWYNDRNHDPVNDTWQKRIDNLKKEIEDKNICCNE